MTTLLVNTQASAIANRTSSRRDLALLRELLEKRGTWVGMDAHGNIVEADGIIVPTDIPNTDRESGNPSWWSSLNYEGDKKAVRTVSTGIGLTSKGVDQFEELLALAQTIH